MEIKNGTSIGVTKQAGKINICNLKSDEEWSSRKIVVAYEKTCVVSNIILQTVLLCRTLTASGKFSLGVKGIERLECITVFTEVVSQLCGNLHLLCSQAVKFSGKKIIEM